MLIVTCIFVLLSMGVLWRKSYKRQQAVISRLEREIAGIRGAIDSAHQTCVAVKSWLASDIPPDLPFYRPVVRFVIRDEEIRQRIQTPLCLENGEHVAYFLVIGDDVSVEGTLIKNDSRNILNRLAQLYKSS